VLCSLYQVVVLCVCLRNVLGIFQLLNWISGLIDFLLKCKVMLIDFLLKCKVMLIDFFVEM
jgi:hypothetical protein